MSKLYWIGLALFIVLSTMGVLQVRTRMSEARLGSDVMYILDRDGNAAVRVVEKTYFVDVETQRNFDALVARTGQPDAENFGKGIQESVKRLGDMIGRAEMEVSDFQARFERSDDYGARVYSFCWGGFAQLLHDRWVLDFRAAGAVKLTKDSSLSVIIPEGMSALRVEPHPSIMKGQELVWRGAGEMQWPYIEYR